MNILEGMSPDVTWIEFSAKLDVLKKKLPVERDKEFSEG